MRKVCPMVLDLAVLVKLVTSCAPPTPGPSLSPLLGEDLSDTIIARVDGEPIRGLRRKP